MRGTIALKVAAGAASLAACSLLASTGTAAASVAMASMGSWNGTTGYVYGRPYIASTTAVYGVLALGGSSQTGSAYKLTKSGTTWSQTVISSFTGGAAGGFPVGGLTSAATGTTLYGAAYTGGNTASACNVGGITGCGVIYSLAPPTSGTTWTRTVLYTFLGGTDGSQPVGDLLIDSTGALYGATTFAGCTRTLTYGSGCGVIFKLTPPVSGSTKWTESILYRFQGGTDGAYPGGRLVMDAAGNIYGTTLYGGAQDCTTVNGTPDSRCGTVFKLTKSGTTYAERILYTFTNGANGSLPAPGLAMDSKGDLFGATMQGGNSTLNCTQFGKSGCGLVFELAVPASGTAYTESTLTTFTGANGASPGAPIIDGAGKLYGVASLNSVADTACTVSFYCGAIYELASSSGVYKATTVYSFTGASSIAGPDFSMAADASGTLYGVTEYNVTSTMFNLTGTGYTVP